MSWFLNSELIVMFVVLGGLIYNLVSTKREIRRDREKAARGDEGKE